MNERRVTMLRTVEYKVGTCHGTTTVESQPKENDESIIRKVELRMMQTLQIKVDSCRVVPLY